MKSIEKRINKLYIGDKELFTGNVNLGSDKINTFHEYVLPFRKGTAELMDIVVYDKAKDVKRFISADNLSLIDCNNYEPIGIVVIPSSHDVYGTGEAGIMALVEANCTTPDTGSVTTHQHIYWGNYNSLDVPELFNFNKVNGLGTMNGELLDTISSNTNLGYLPTDFYTAESNKLSSDGTRRYYASTSSSYSYLPSPFVQDGARNIQYGDTTFNTNNALSDFNGFSNTQIICSKITVEDWKTIDPIPNSYSAGNYPAAACCWRFHTIGTSQGDWYLPACGELGYGVVNRNLINDTIALINTWASKTVALPLYTNYGYWSSSEHSLSIARDVYFNTGNAYHGGKGHYNYVRPFLRVRALSI